MSDDDSDGAGFGGAVSEDSEDGFGDLSEDEDGFGDLSEEDEDTGFGVSCPPTHTHGHSCHTRCTHAKH